MRPELMTNAQVLRRVSLVTAISVASSFAMTLLAMRILFGADPNMMIPAHQFQIVALGLSIGAPLLICPLASYSSSKLLKKLNIARHDLEILAYTDQLTGLLNRRGFDAAAHEALEAARTANSPIAVMICDIDQFKRLNDSLGHDFGDECLMRVSDVLRGFAASHKVIAGRQGGDEFVLMLPGAPPIEAKRAAESIRTACADIALAGNPLRRVSMSIGVATSAQADASLSALIRRADVALYEVKRAGRNRVVVADVAEQWSSAA